MVEHHEVSRTSIVEQGQPVHRTNNQSVDRLDNNASGGKKIIYSGSIPRNNKSRRDMLQNMNKSQLKLFKDVAARPFNQ